MSVATLGAIAASGGGGGGGYIAKAVHFDGSTYLSTNSLNSTDNTGLSFSFWMNFPVGADFPYVFVVDPNGDFLSNVYIDVVDFSPDFQVNTQVADIDGSNKFAANQPSAISLAGWHHFLYSVSVGASMATEVKLYIDDVEAALAPQDSGSLPFNIATNGKPFFVGSDGTPSDLILGDVSDLWIAPGVSLLDGMGNIPDATRRLFISASGKPVDPSGFPAAAVLFSGNAASFGTNQGTGGSFTMTGALTNASTSPSD